MGSAAFKHRLGDLVKACLSGNSIETQSFLRQDSLLLCAKVIVILVEDVYACPYTNETFQYLSDAKYAMEEHRPCRVRCHRSTTSTRLLPNCQQKQYMLFGPELVVTC